MLKDVAEYSGTDSRTSIIIAIEFPVKKLFSFMLFVSFFGLSLNLVKNYLTASSCFPSIPELVKLFWESIVKLLFIYIVYSLRLRFLCSTNCLDILLTVFSSYNIWSGVHSAYVFKLDSYKVSCCPLFKYVFCLISLLRIKYTHFRKFIRSAYRKYS